MVHGETQRKGSTLGLLSLRVETTELIAGLSVNHELKDLLNTYFVSASMLGSEDTVLNKTPEKGDAKSLPIP